MQIKQSFFTSKSLSLRKISIIFLTNFSLSKVLLPKGYFVKLTRSSPNIGLGTFNEIKSTKTFRHSMCLIESFPLIMLKQYCCSDGKKIYSNKE